MGWGSAALHELKLQKPPSNPAYNFISASTPGPIVAPRPAAQRHFGRDDVTIVGRLVVVPPPPRVETVRRLRVRPDICA